MEKIYQIPSYNMLMIDKKTGDDQTVISVVQNILSGISNTSIIDNSLSVQAKNAEIKRAELLLYSISVLMMIIALFHIINTMFHLLDARRYSFAVLRAMGITEGDFYKMLVKQALKYAVLTCGVILLIYYGVVQRVTADMLSHVYGYINSIQGVSAGTGLLVISSIVMMFVVSVTIAARHILGLSVVEELKASDR